MEHIVSCEECGKHIFPGEDYEVCDVCTSLFCSETCLDAHKERLDAMKYGEEQE